MLKTKLSAIVAIGHWSMTGNIASANVNYDAGKEPPNAVLADLIDTGLSISTYEWLVGNFCKEGELVIDIHGATGKHGYNQLFLSDFFTAPDEDVGNN